MLVDDVVEHGGLTLCNGLQERGEYETEIVAGIETVPESTGRESCETRSEPWLLAFWRDSEVHVVSKPVICIHVPVFEVGACILGRLDTPRIDVL